MASPALLPVRPHSGFPSLSLLNLRGDLSLASLTLMWDGEREDLSLGTHLARSALRPMLRPFVAVVLHLLCIVGWGTNWPFLSNQALAWQQITVVSVLPIGSCDPALTMVQTSTTVPQILP